MVSLHGHVFLLLSILLRVNIVATTVVHNVIDFGAKPDGVADATQAFLKTWKSACAALDPAVIVVPVGRYLPGPITLNGRKCKSANITIQINGSLIAPLDHRVLGKVDSWLKLKLVSGVSIVGGVLDARGSAWWTCKNSGRDCSNGATTLKIADSSNVVIKGVTSLNSQMFHIAINGCQNVIVEGVNIIAPDNSPNTDGIHVQSSMHVTIMNSTMRTGDDCISVGPGAKNLWIENILCGPGHGISIGSLARDKIEQGVQNVTVKEVILSNTTNGLRIKSWARPSTGFVQGILFQNITMHSVQNPIIVDQHYCPGNKDCPSQESGIKISNVTYDGITGTSSTEDTVIFDCSSDYPCTGIKLQNINITSIKKVAQSTCSNVEGDAVDIVQPKSCF